ncbi:MAG TPA: APC family permease, partial [Vicinamibacteria bacterium]
MSEASALSAFKRIVVGRPIPSRLAHHERLSKATGLAVLSSDALSSVAYATEEIVRVLVLAGGGALWLATPIGVVIAGLLLLVTFSYRQTIHAYPNGGGAYIVARENIGVSAGLVAGSSLLVDYVLTVAVSTAAGVAAITSAFPEWYPHRVALGLAFMGLLMVGNLRGVRESGRIFALPTYFFLLTMLALLGVGLARVLSGSVPAPPPEAEAAAGGVGVLTTFLVLRAFANGCTAMTGVEAISNGVPAFRPPEARNAATTLMIMAGLCVTLFMGTTLLAHAYHILPTHDETVVSQLARSVFGGRGLAYYAVQAGTSLILILAANTAYQDFPRLASVMARDGYLPRQFRNQGDRLAFSNGILVLSGAAALLVIAFQGDTHALIPLYMIGVFVSFSLSQAGMFLKWRREREPGWRGHALLNGAGAVLTTIVLGVVAVTKFSEGAWIIVGLIPLLVLHLRGVRRHYDNVASQLSLKEGAAEPLTRNTVIVPISGVHRAVVRALHYARSISPDVRAVYVETDPATTPKIEADWRRWGEGVPLVVRRSPYRSLMEPLLDYIEEIDGERPDDFVTVVLPEFVPARWWHHLLHNQRALFIKGALLFKPNTVVISVP